MQVARLVGAAAADGAAAHAYRHFLWLVAGIVDVVEVGRVQAQVDGVAVEHGVAGLGIERAQQALGAVHRVFAAADPEHVAAVGDFHAQAQLDLAQVAVERPGQVGQALAVGRFQGEVVVDDRVGHGGRVPHGQDRPEGRYHRLAIN